MQHGAALRLFDIPSARATIAVAGVGMPPATFAELARRVESAIANDDLSVARRALDEVGHLDPAEVPHAVDSYRLDNVSRAVRTALGSAASPMREHFLALLRRGGVAREDELFAPWMDAESERHVWAARAALVVTVPQARRPMVYGAALPTWYSIAPTPTEALDAVANALPCAPSDLAALAAHHALPVAFLVDAMTLPAASPAARAASGGGIVRRARQHVDSVLLLLRVSPTPRVLSQLAELVEIDEAALRRRMVGDRRLTSYGDDRWGLRSVHGRPPRAHGLGAAVREIVETSHGHLSAGQVAELVSVSMPATRATVTSAISSLSRRDAAQLSAPPQRPVPDHIDAQSRWVTLRLRGSARRSSMLGVSRHLHWAVGVDGRRMRRAFALGDGHDVVIELRDNGRAVVRYLPHVVSLLGIGDECELELRLDLHTDEASARALCACHGDATAA